MNIEILTSSEELGQDNYEETALQGVWICPGSGSVVILNGKGEGVKVDTATME